MQLRRHKSTHIVLSFQTNGHSSEAVYQERLSRLESDKECLILQVRRLHRHQAAEQQHLNGQLGFN